MVRTLVIRRHTDNDGDALTPDGVAAALRLGRGEHLGPYALAVSSGAQRATQTIACLLAGMGSTVPGGVVVDAGFRSDREDEWRDAYAATGSGHLDDFAEQAPALVEEDGRVLADALRRTIDRLDDGERALVVGHSPTTEAAVRSLTGVTVAPLGTGEAVVLTVDGEDTTVDRVVSGAA